MKESKNSEIDHLIHACLDGELTEAEADKLSALIEESEEVRDRYWELASIHGLLEQSLQQASLKVVTGQEPPASRKAGVLSFRNPYITAAAGILWGIFCASIVWASTVPALKRSALDKVQLLFESFESYDSLPNPRVPDTAGKWYGNFTPAVSISENGQKPHRGEYVAEFTPHPVRKFSYAWYIIDLEDIDVLEDGQIPLELEVNASFLSSSIDFPAHYQIRLAAFAEEPAAVRPIWNDETTLYNTVLQHVGRNEKFRSSGRDWNKLRATMEIPSGSRSLLISLAAAAGEDTEVKHYLDAVRVFFKVAPNR